MNLLSLEGIGYSRHGMPLLADISLQLPAGRRSFVMGPNGAGKTLLLRICHGLIRPSAGRLQWTGPRPRQAMVFQRPVMLRRSALANVTYALEIAGVPRSRRAARARAALAELGLQRLAERPARVLSGGEQQRLALARCWALAPDVLFLDEPTAALDPASTAAIETAVRRFHETGVTIVMSSHDLGQAGRLADDVIFLHGGRLQEHTTAERFFASPATERGRRFVAGDLVL